MNDIAGMMHASFDLPRTIQLTGWSINRALSNNVPTKHMIDSRDLNCTGVFRDSYTLGKSKQRFLYLCQPGTCPHKPGHGHKWSDFITEPLYKAWVPSRSNLYPDNYEGLKKHLKSHLQKKSCNDDGQKRKSKEQDSSSSKKHKGATKKSFIRLLNCDHSAISVEIDDNTVQLLVEAISTQSLLTNLLDASSVEEQFVS